MYTTEVMMIKVESDRDGYAVDATIKLKRHLTEERYTGAPPDVNDLPPDFRKTLRDWLNLWFEEIDTTIFCPECKNGFDSDIGYYDVNKPNVRFCSNDCLEKHRKHSK